MIIVLGSVTVDADKVAQAVALSREHVARSRLEPGCIEHGVSHDAQTPERLVFVEKWADMAALERHFAIPESRQFVRALSALATSPPSMKLFEAREVVPGLNDTV